MILETDTLLQLDALHYALDYIPKRAIRYFINPDTRAESTDLLLEEAQDVIQHPEEYIEEETGNRFLFHALIILGYFKEERAIPLIRQIGLMDHEAIDELLGDSLFDTISLAVAEIFTDKIDALQNLIEDISLDPSIRATCLQALSFVYGRGAISRRDLIAYLSKLLAQPEDDLPFFYDILALVAMSLHTEELMEPLRKMYLENRIDASLVSLKDIEDNLLLPEAERIAECKQELDIHLDHPIAYLEVQEDLELMDSYDRNEPCPCGSGIKFKKCCL